MIQKKIIICGQGSFVIAGSTVEFSLRIFTSEGELQLLNPITRILSAKYIPEKLISILVTMALNEQAEFVIEAAYFQNYFSEWLGYSSTSSVKFEILVMKVLEPIQIFDGFVMRLFESTGGKLSPHSKARFEISASIEINGKIVANFNEVIVRLSSLPLVWAECLKNMKEGDGVILQCTVNGENSEYFNGTGTDFDIEKYCISGNTDIIIKLHRFIIGKSAAKAIHRYCHEEINTINVLIENQEFKLACKKSENILKYLKEFNAEIFDDVRNI